MNSEIQIIEAYNQLLYHKFEVHELTCLSDNQYQYNGENILAINNPAVVTASKAGLLDRLHEVCSGLKKCSFQKNPNVSQSELIIATADLKYRLGTLCLYQPHIVKLSDSYRYHRGKKFYVYNQTRNDARFNRELPIAFECLYKFWQRLGDYLITFFPELLLEKNGLTYFHAPFQHISDNYVQLEASENYQWLKTFSKNGYPIFNKHRKFFVHHAGYDNLFFEKFLNANQDHSDAIEALDQERQDWTIFLREQLQMCNEGYLKLMYFLNELDIRKNEDDGTFLYSLKALPND